MFKSPRTALLIPGVLCIGITLFAGTLLVRPELRNTAYWYTAGALMAAEAMVFLAFMDVGGGHRDRAMPFRIGNVLVAVLYLVFTFVMIIPYAAEASTNAICLLQLAGLFTALTLHVLFLLAHRAVSNQARRAAAERADVVNFKVEIESFKTEHENLLLKTPELREEMRELSEAVRFASESIPGSETADSRIHDAIGRLKKCAQTDDADMRVLSVIIQELLVLFRKRQILIRGLR